MRLRWIALAASAGAILLGAVVLGSWMLAAGPIASPAAMKVNISAALIALGAAVLLHLTRRPRAARLLALTALAIAIATLVEHLGGVDLGIDELLADDPGARAAPGRASAAVAGAVAIAALGTLLLGVERRGVALAPLLGAAVLLLGLYAVAGLAYEVAALGELAPPRPGAASTALAATALGLAILLADPTRGAAWVLASDTVGGHLARRLLPVFGTLALVLGWLRLLGERAGLYGDDVGFALHAGATLALVVALTWASTVRLARADLARRRAAEELVAADRLASIGRLTAGVAHEINNPLGALILLLQATSRSCRDPDVRADVETALTCAASIRGFVRDLQRLTRPDDDRRAPVELAHVVDTSLRIASIELRPRARVVRAFGPAPRVEANEARLGQVVLNLLINAAQAIPGDDPSAHEVRIALATDARGWAVIEVTDTGRGIPAADLSRLFDAYFTTRSDGTGLGLAIASRIVAGLGGEIQVESAPGRGSTFRVALPPARPRADDGC